MVLRGVCFAGASREVRGRPLPGALRRWGGGQRPVSPAEPWFPRGRTKQGGDQQVFLLRRLILTETSRGSLIWVNPPGLHCVVAKSVLLCEEGELGQGKWRDRQRGLFAHQSFDLGGW